MAVMANFDRFKGRWTSNFMRRLQPILFLEQYYEVVEQLSYYRELASVLHKYKIKHPVPIGNNSCQGISKKPHPIEISSPRVSPLKWRPNMKYYLKMCIPCS